MNAPVTRREFLQQSARLGALSLVATLPWSRWAAAATPTEPATSRPADLAVVEGDDSFANTLRAVALVGGMSRFVKPGQRVALLINAPRWWTKPGSFTSPEVSLAVVQLCADAGARELVTIVDPPAGYWQRSRHASQCAAALARLQSAPGGRTTVDIPKAHSLKRADISRALLEADVLINLPIAKHHAGTGFTGCLKNMMGGCSGSTNRFFHNGSGAGSDYGDVVFLSQCIADLNLVRKPDLNVCDATEFLVTNGPAGPGELGHARSVVAGTDPVAVDAYCASTFLKLRPARVHMIRQAFQHGIGEIDWTKLTWREEKA